jgi:4-amino-4-deoxy-L-arabinose transferase-like glycosyltransferase
VLLALFALNAGLSQRSKSPTVDEFAHVPAGDMGITTGQFDLYGKTPPLGRSLFSLPLLASKPILPDPMPGSRMAGWYPWTYATGFFNANVRAHGMEYVTGVYRDARFMVVAMAVALGAILFIWGRVVHGAAGGLVALALFTLDPNILAHSRLATVDLAETLFFFLAVAGIVAWMHKPGVLRLVLAGLACGAALATKFTAVLLLPVAVGLAVVSLLQASPETRTAHGRRLATGLLTMAALTLLVVNTSYLFGGSLRPLGDYRFRSDAMNLIQQPWLGWMPVPLPEDFIRGFDAQQVDLEVGDFPNYFNGRWSRQGWWYYYPAAWLMKTPLALVALILAAVGLAATEALDWRRRHHRIRTGLPPGDPLRELSAWAIVLGIGIPMVAACFLNRLDIGVRYILPVYPFIFLGLAGLGRLFRRREPVAAGLVLAGIVLTGITTLSAYPHYLGFANLLAGGSQNGWRVLSNSNNDWGQDLPALRRELERQGETSVRLAYFGHVEPSSYGLDYTVPLPGASGADALAEGRGRFPYTFKPGLYAISANLLVGLPYQVMDHGRWVPVGHVLTEPQEIFAWFRKRPPDAVVGGSILLFRVEDPAL